MDEDNEDPEVLVRNGADVRLGEGDETKYLGPSSGTQMTRIVMLLAKQFTDSDTIKSIVTESKARHVKAMYAAEASKPTSKIYPLTSDVAAEGLPNRGLTDLLVQLYNLKGTSSRAPDLGLGRPYQELTILQCNPCILLFTSRLSPKTSRLCTLAMATTISLSSSAWSLL